MRYKTIKSKFTEVSTLLGIEYDFDEKRYYGLGVSPIPVTCHRMKLVYKASEISIEYEFGSINMAKISTRVKLENDKYFFFLKKKSTFRRLFGKDKRSLEVIHTDPDIQSKVEEVLNTSGLEEIARNTDFEPQVEFNRLNGEVELLTTFYLGFKDKEESLMPIIDFYKGLINLFANEIV